MQNIIFHRINNESISPSDFVLILEENPFHNWTIKVRSWFHLVISKLNSRWYFNFSKSLKWQLFCICGPFVYLYKHVCIDLLKYPSMTIITLDVSKYYAIKDIVTHVFVLVALAVFYMMVRLVLLQFHITRFTRWN